MAKIGHDGKSIAFAKWAVWVKKLKMPKKRQKPLYEHVQNRPIGQEAKANVSSSSWLGRSLLSWEFSGTKHI